jgi:hypothetical protein
MLTVIGETKDRINNGVVWECRCDCGNIIKAKGEYLVRGFKLSCGCLTESIAVKNIK